MLRDLDVRFEFDISIQYLAKLKESKQVDSGAYEAYVKKANAELIRQSLELKPVPKGARAFYVFTTAKRLKKSQDYFDAFFIKFFKTTDKREPLDALRIYQALLPMGDVTTSFHSLLYKYFLSTINDANYHKCKTIDEYCNLTLIAQAYQATARMHGYDLNTQEFREAHLAAEECVFSVLSTELSPDLPKSHMIHHLLSVQKGQIYDTEKFKQIKNKVVSDYLKDADPEAYDKALLDSKPLMQDLSPQTKKQLDKFAYLVRLKDLIDKRSKGVEVSGQERDYFEKMRIPYFVSITAENRYRVDKCIANYYLNEAKQLNSELKMVQDQSELTGLPSEWVKAELPGAKIAKKAFEAAVHFPFSTAEKLDFYMTVNKAGFDIPVESRPLSLSRQIGLCKKDSEMMPPYLAVNVTQGTLEGVKQKDVVACVYFLIAAKDSRVKAKMIHAALQEGTRLNDFVKIKSDGGFFSTSPETLLKRLQVEWDKMKTRAQLRIQKNHHQLKLQAVKGMQADMKGGKERFPSVLLQMVGVQYAAGVPTTQNFDRYVCGIFFGKEEVPLAIAKRLKPNEAKGAGSTASISAELSPRFLLMYKIAPWLKPESRLYKTISPVVRKVALQALVDKGDIVALLKQDPVLNDPTIRLNFDNIKPFIESCRQYVGVIQSDGKSLKRCAEIKSSFWLNSLFSNPVFMGWYNAFKLSGELSIQQSTSRKVQAVAVNSGRDNSQIFNAENGVL